MRENGFVRREVWEKGKIDKLKVYLHHHQNGGVGREAGKKGGR